MPERMKQEALQLELVLESYGACKFFHTFPKEKPFNYSPLKLPSMQTHVCDALVIKSRQCVVSNNKLYTFCC